MTEAQFNCRVQTCPQLTFARQLLTDTTTGPVSGLATNFLLSGGNRPARNVSKDEALSLAKMAASLIKSSKLLNKKEIKSFVSSVQKGESSPVLAIGQLSQDGRDILIANWTAGTMNDTHYGDDSEFYESILIIAEPQNDGTFRPASGSGSIADRGCSYASHADLDGDGVDEIILSCSQLEGQYSYAFVKRVMGKWQITYGPPRN